MIRITRTRDPKNVEYLLPYLSFHDNTESIREKFVKSFAIAMANTPESVFMVQAWNGEDIVGFLTASVLEDYTWISQAWSKTGNPLSVIDEMLNRTILWTIALGRLSLRAEVIRDSEAIFRRFHFEQITTIVEHRIKPEFVDLVLQRGKEYIDG